MLNKNHIHFIGIGGSGMSAIAHLALNKGIKVTGSDRENNPNVKSVKEHGAHIFRDHNSKHIDDTVDLVIYTEAVDKKTNPEYLETKKRELPHAQLF